MSKKGYSKGQAIIEFVLGVTVLAVFLQGLFVFCHLSLLRQRALAAARLGTWLETTGLVSEETIHAELEDHFRKMTPHPSVSWAWRRGRFLETPASRFYHLRKTEAECRYEHAFLRRLGFEALRIKETVVAQKETGQP